MAQEYQVRLGPIEMKENAVSYFRAAIQYLLWVVLGRLFEGFQGQLFPIAAAQS